MSPSRSRLVTRLRGLALASGVAARHLLDDPVAAAVLATRVAPGPVKRRALGDPTPSAPAAARRPAAALRRVLARWDRGEHDAALADARAIAADPATPATTVARLASFCLAVDRPAAAREVLTHLPADHPAATRLEALTRWREGRLREAVTLLDEPSGAPSSRRLRGPEAVRTTRARDRLRAEYAVLQPTWSPTLPLAAAITPVRGRALHVVTNSLPHANAGYTVRTHAVARAEQSVGLDPHVVTRLGFPVAQGVPAAGALDVVDTVPYHRLLTRGPLPGRADALLARNVALASALVEHLQPALLHAHTNHVNGQIALALRERHTLPVVYEVRGFLEDSWLSRREAGSAVEAAGSERYLLARALETHCMREADHVVTLGTVMKDEIVARGVPAERVTVVPNAAGEEFLTPLPDPGPVRARLGISPDEVVIGSVSTFYAHEGLDTLVRAAAILRSRGLPVRLLLVGDGQERDTLARAVDACGLADTALMPGRVPYTQVRDYYAAIDVFCVPRVDTRVSHLVTPLKPIEAMAGGRAVVASRVTALAEIVQDGETGLLSPPDDPDALADTLATLVTDPARRAQLGEAARAWVARERTWAANATRLATLYSSLGAW